MLNTVRFRNIFFVLLGALLIIGIATFLSGAVSAQDEKPDNAVGYYTQDGKVVWIIPGKGIDVTQHSAMGPCLIEKLYPMTPEAEAAIVHTALPCPIIIDGTTYEGKQITLFDGKRLRYTSGKDGKLYGFTTPEKMEQFIKKEYGITFPDKLVPLQKEQGRVSIEKASATAFWKDAWYTGQAMALAPGNGIPYLYQIGFDNCISSVQTNTTGSLSYLFDSTNYGGEYYGMPSGSSYPWLALQGWDDRASSVWINQ